MVKQLFGNLLLIIIYIAIGFGRECEGLGQLSLVLIAVDIFIKTDHSSRSHLINIECT